MVVYGIHPVLEALKAGRVVRLRVSREVDQRLQGLLAHAVAAGTPVESVARDVLDRATRGGVHQGVVAEIRQLPEYTVSEILAAARPMPLLLILDEVQDPQNLGAILRTADAAGVDGVIRQSRRAASLGGAAAKASAGAVAWVKTAEVVNIARTLDEVKRSGLWTVGLCSDAPRRYHEVDLSVPTAIVLGAEGTGLRRLVRERCDWLVSIPMQGRVTSLNVSVAAAVVLFEVVRQRQEGGFPAGKGSKGRSG